MYRWLMASENDWWQAIQEYDFDDAYFNDVTSNNDCESNDGDWTYLESEWERRGKV